MVVSVKGEWMFEFIWKIVWKIARCGVKRRTRVLVTDIEKKLEKGIDEEGMYLPLIEVAHDFSVLEDYGKKRGWIKEISK